MRGTDVHPFYQRGLNWKAAQDLYFAWVKVSDGGAAYTRTEGGVKYVPDTHVAGAKAAGIPVGGYHYAQLSPAPERQADVLLAEVRRLDATGVAPLLDLEAPFKPDATAKAFAVAFCKRVAAAGFRPAVYMSASFAAVLRPDQWDVPGLVIVIARYGARPEAPGAGRYVGRYDVHQYTSGGTLPGSAGPVDLDESYTNAHLTTASEEIDDMWTEADFNTPLFTDNVGTPQVRTVRFRDVMGELRDRSAATIKALTDLAAAVAKNSGVTADEIAAAMAPAVSASLLPSLRDLLREALGEDNAGQADAIVDELAQRLNIGGAQ